MHPPHSQAVVTIGNCHLGGPPRLSLLVHPKITPWPPLSGELGTTSLGGTSTKVLLCRAALQHRRSDSMDIQSLIRDTRLMIKFRS